MADDDEDDKGTGTPPPPAGGDTETTRIISLDNLATKVDQLFDMLKGGGRPRTGTRADAAEDVSSAVRAELGKLKDEEGRRQRGTQLAGRIDLIEQTLKTFTEKRPKEHRWITRKMWGSDDD